MMKQIQATQGGSNPYTLPALALIATIALSFGFLVLLVGVRVGLQIGERLVHPNPFAAYETLRPGQPLSNLAGFQERLPEGACHFTAFDALYHTMTRTDGIGHVGECQLPPEERVFRLIRVEINNQRITTLFLYSESLQESVLLLYWGAPDAIGMSIGAEQRVLRWVRGTYTATASVRHDDSVVRVVTLQAKS